jgi:hypothetical protein
VVPRASVPVFMFCVPVLIFDGSEGVGSRFNVLRSRTCFRRYRRRPLLFPCFASPHTFLTIPRASGNVFMFCTPELVFGGTEGVSYRFHVLRSRTHFSAVPRGSGPVFMFCVPALIFGGTEGIGSRFRVLRARPHFRRSRWRWVPFSCFALPDTFSAVRRDSGPVFMFCTSGHVFDGSEGVGSYFHVFRPRTYF